MAHAQTITLKAGMITSKKKAWKAHPNLFEFVEVTGTNSGGMRRKRRGRVGEGKRMKGGGEEEEEREEGEEGEEEEGEEE